MYGETKNRGLAFVTMGSPEEAAAALSNLDSYEFFKAEGRNVVSAEVIFHDNPRRSAGYGFVSFKTRKEAEEVLVRSKERFLWEDQFECNVADSL
ncbi:28 kDa ribonucleoprotein chloroplastic-like [Tripterygium wilfordii]|uniref:28 kDa ribonucleoprotein chloroplastic-like n=1 Tax=Tripterygium wilfordii TaxID=458696 RepID=A0A7J7DKL8_TRIWF|nr:28 kDa ribonucleoprotein chloroplastic-like [Tripterygium wilfordii]